jgi:hypothetical protein
MKMGRGPTRDVKVNGMPTSSMYWFKKQNRSRKIFVGENLQPGGEMHLPTPS